MGHCKSPNVPLQRRYRSRLFRASYVDRLMFHLHFLGVILFDFIMSHEVCCCQPRPFRWCWPTWWTGFQLATLSLCRETPWKRWRSFRPTATLCRDSAGWPDCHLPIERYPIELLPWRRWAIKTISWPIRPLNQRRLLDPGRLALHANSFHLAIGDVLQGLGLSALIALQFHCLQQYHQINSNVFRR